MAPPEGAGEPPALPLGHSAQRDWALAGLRDDRASLKHSGNFLFKIKIVANHLLRAKRKT